MAELTHRIDEYKACQLAEWYQTFSKPLLGRKKGVTLRSTILPVPSSFSEYLTQDGVHLPAGVRLSSCLGFGTADNDDDNDDDWSSDGEEEGEVSTRSAVRFDLEDLTKRLEAEIADLGGAVLPKTNWSAPRDAAWINEGTLKCQTAGDVYLLLQSSDFINSDVQLLEERGTKNDLHIVLRKWCHLYPSHEFRCFVIQHRLVAISQRQTDQYFEHVVQDRDDIQFMIEEFFREIVQHKYADGNIENYVMDVYIDREDRVWIIDFNLWASRTDSLLFTWDELNGWLADKDPELRIIETAREILPLSLNNYRAPVDTVHLAALTSTSQDSAFQIFMDMCERPSAVRDDGIDESH